MADIKILNYSSPLREHFESLNREWLEKYFTVEAIDQKFFAAPTRSINAEI